MTTKQPIRYRMKLVIDALRQGRKRYSDLTKLRPRIPERTLTRILKDHLEYWGLAVKKDGFWSWYDQARVFDSRYEYQIFIEHSRNLLTALFTLLKNPVKEVFIDVRPFTPEQIAKEESEAAMEELVREAKTKEFAKQHLQTGYPYIFNRLQTLDNLRAKLEDAQQKKAAELLQTLQGMIKTPDQYMILDWKKKEPRSWFRKLFPEHLLFRRNVKVMYGPFGTKEEAEEILDEVDAQNPIVRNEHGEHYILGPIYVRDPKVAAFDETMDKMIDVWQVFAGDILKLIMKIDNGTPLEGRCDGCPRVQVSARKTETNTES